MLTQIRVQGFKSLANVEGLVLGQVNVFIGANGSGKTNLLEAIGVLGAAASGRVDDVSLSRRGVRLGGPTQYKTSIKGLRIRPTISLEASSGEVQEEEAIYRVALDNPIKNPEEAWRYRTESLLKDGKRIVSYSPRGKTFVSGLSTLTEEILELQPYSGLVALIRGYHELSGAPRELLRHLSEYAVFSPVTPVLRGIQADPGQRDPIGMLGGRLPEAIEDVLDKGEGKLGSMDIDQVLDLLDWVDEFDVVKPTRHLLSPSVPSVRRVIRFRDHWMVESRKELSGYDASEGALYVLFMLTAATHPKMPPLFAIDNFDQAMHPRLARATIRLFCQQVLEATPQRQILLTTHNPLVLDGLDLKDDRIRLFTVERDKQGATRVDRVQVSDEVLQATEGGLSLSNLWVMGRLGGVPDLF
jgi:energy-coupling factor transporter ATP-binding protein EcfA2